MIKINFLLIYPESDRTHRANHRGVHALRDMGNQGKFTKKQSPKTNVYLCISVLIFDDIYAVDGETPFLGLPAFLADRVINVVVGVTLG